MKPPWEWTEDDMEWLIANRIPESIELDYKACPALDHTDRKKRELSKDVSAFANSAGGSLVYGIKEDNSHLPCAIDEGYDRADISKEWLEQIINSSIQRRIEGIRINQVDLNRNHPGRVAYVVYVPQSTRAPHMAADNKFYKRFNFESVPMEEYEVRDASRRLDAPDLSLELSIGQNNSTGLQYNPTTNMSLPITLEVAIRNNSPTPAEYMQIRLFVDNRIVVVSHPEFKIGNNVTITIAGNRLNATFLYENKGIMGSLPIWEGVLFQLSDISLSIPSGVTDYVLHWEVHSPRMEKKSRTCLLKSDGSILTLVKM